jgi:hypothetical protein
MSTFWEKISKWSPWGLVSGLYQRLTSPIAPVRGEAQPCCEATTEDMVILQLADLQIHVRRQKPVDVPSEIHVIVPRVEIRRHYTRADGCGGEEELIYNSVTVVHAPRPGATSEPTVIPLYEYDNTERPVTQKPTWYRKK